MQSEPHWDRLKRRLQVLMDRAPHDWKSSIATRLGLSVSQFLRYVREGYDEEPPYSLGKEMEKVCAASGVIFGEEEDDDDSKGGYAEKQSLKVSPVSEKLRQMRQSQSRKAISLRR